MIGLREIRRQDTYSHETTPSLAEHIDTTSKRLRYASREAFPKLGNTLHIAPTNQDRFGNSLLKSGN